MIIDYKCFNWVSYCTAPILFEIFMISGSSFSIKSICKIFQIRNSTASSVRTFQHIIIVINTQSNSTSWSAFITPLYYFILHDSKSSRWLHNMMYMRNSMLSFLEVSCWVTSYPKRSFFLIRDFWHYFYNFSTSSPTLPLQSTFFTLFFTLCHYYTNKKCFLHFFPISVRSTGKRSLTLTTFHLCTCPFQKCRQQSLHPAPWPLSVELEARNHPKIPGRKLQLSFKRRLKAQLQRGYRFHVLALHPLQLWRENHLHIT